MKIIREKYNSELCLDLKKSKVSCSLMKIIREKYNSELCLDLKKSKVSCSEIEDFTYDALNILLQQEENKVKGI